MSEKYALFIGRWQPFHNGHKHIIQNALDEGKNVLIACRETPITGARTSASNAGEACRTTVSCAEIAAMGTTAA